MAAWIKPKMAHKHMVQRLLQVRAHVILCFRAEEKIEMVRDDKGKMQIVPKQSRIGLDGWIPICEKNLPFELTCSFLLTADAPGVPKPIKLQEQHRSLFQIDKPITEESGQRLARWASGGSAPRVTPAATPPASAPDEATSSSFDDDGPQYITEAQAVELDALCSDYGVPSSKLKEKAGVERLAMIKVADFERAKKWIKAQAQAAEKSA